MAKKTVLNVGDHVEIKYFKETCIFMGFPSETEDLVFLECLDFYTVVKKEWVKKLKEIDKNGN